MGFFDFVADSISISLPDISNTINEGRYLNAKNEYLRLLDRVKNDINLTSGEVLLEYIVSLKSEIETLKEEVIHGFGFHNHHLTKEYMDEIVSQDRILDISLKGTSLAEDRRMYFKAKVECEKIIKEELHLHPAFMQLSKCEQDEYADVIIRIAELNFLLKQHWIII